MITYATEPHKTRSMIVCWVSTAVLHHSHHRFSEKHRPSASADEWPQTTSRHFTQMFGGCTPASSPLTSIPIQPKSSEENSFADQLSTLKQKPRLLLDRLATSRPRETPCKRHERSFFPANVPRRKTPLSKAYNLSFSGKFHRCMRKFK